MTVYVVALSKGGTTKTTTAAEVADDLGRRGRRVLVIDLDAQRNMSTRMGIPTRQALAAHPAAMQVLTGESSAAEAAIASPTVPGVSVIVPGADLENAHRNPEIITGLRDYLPELTEWDDVVIDTPPSMHLVTLAALAAADVVIAPVATETEAYDQVAALADLITSRIAPRLHKGQRIHWIIPTRYDRRRLLDREVIEELERQFPGQVTTPVRESQLAKESYNAAMPVSRYRPASPVAADYRSVMAQVTQPSRDTQHTHDTHDTVNTPDAEGVSR